mgnify:CR=1 FL=1
MNRDLRFEDLKEYANEFACSIAEAARDIVFDFFAAAGFREDVLEEELASKSDEEIIEMLKDRKAVQRNMLTNPFEKFERKRFLYYSKDLSVISMNHALFGQMKEEDWERVRRQMREDLRKYYDGMGGV